MKNAAEFTFVFLCICIALLLSPLILLWSLFDDWRMRREMRSEEFDWAEHGEI